MEEDLKNIISGTDPYDTLVKNIIKDKGGTKEDYRNLLDTIAYHESAGTMDPTIKQYGGGPGRGKYQFEGKSGSNRILTSAVRTKNYFKSIGAEVPEFVNNIINAGTGDASKLSSTQQDILALADLRMKGGLDLKDYISGDLAIEDLWADHWWAGSKDLRDKKIKSFNNSQNKRNNLLVNSINNTSNKEFIQPNTRDINKVQVDNTYIQQPNFKQQYSLNSIDKIQKSSNTNFIDFLDDYISNIDDNNLNEFSNGGTHEENPYGGIPMGMGSNGKPNTVEEGETSFIFGDNKFVFSNRINTNGSIKPNTFNINSFALGGDTTDPKSPTRKGNIQLEGYNNPSTHLMRTEMLDDGSWVSFPTLFQDHKTGKWITDYIPKDDTDWQRAYDYAKSIGETINFGTAKEKALSFGMGSWKKQK